MTKPSSRPNATLTIRRSDLDALALGGKGGSLIDRVFMVVAGGIQSRQVGPGTRLPSIRELADTCEISRDTAARAYEKLVAHGLIESRRGSGFYVKSVSRRAPETYGPASLFLGPSNMGLTHWRVRLLRHDPTLQSRTGSGLLPESWIDEAALGTALRSVARSGHRGMAQHGDPKGYLPLRQQLQLKLHEMGVHADPNNIITTNGATEALHLIAHTYLRRPGEFVLVEKPRQYLLTDRLMSTGLEFALVPRLADGPDLDILRAQCEAHRPKFFFCSSILHNPTCTQLAPHKAFQLLRLAEEFDFTIVEDDTYGDLMPQSGMAPVTRLAPLDQLKRVIYVGSFSKTLAPGLRCGFMAASPERIAWLTMYRVLGGIAGPNFGERTVYRLLSQGGYRHHCEQLRARLDDCRPAAIESLKAAGLKFEQLPEAGMFLWAALPHKADAMKVAERLIEQGHLVAPGALFANEERYRAFLRINIAEMAENSMLPALVKLLGR